MLKAEIVASIKPADLEALRAKDREHQKALE
jgi:hypothetical protein